MNTPIVIRNRNMLISPFLIVAFRKVPFSQTQGTEHASRGSCGTHATHPTDAVDDSRLPTDGNEKGMNAAGHVMKAAGE
jgi:hypothetical protein